MNALERLKVVKAKSDHVATDRRNYKSYVDDRVVSGGWTDEDVAEYRAEVERIMQSGTDDEKAAASEFWALKAKQSVPDINARIRQSIAADRRLAA